MLGCLTSLCPKKWQESGKKTKAQTISPLKMMLYGRDYESSALTIKLSARVFATLSRTWAEVTSGK